MNSRLMHMDALAQVLDKWFKTNIQRKAVKIQKDSAPLSQLFVRQRRPFYPYPFYPYTPYLHRPLLHDSIVEGSGLTPRGSNPNCLVIDYVVDSPPGRLSAVSLQLVPAVDCNCGTTQPFEIVFTAVQWILPEAQELQPFEMTVPAVPQVCLLCRQSRTHKVQVLVLAPTNHIHPGKNLVMLCGPGTKSSSASLSTPRRSVKAS